MSEHPDLWDLLYSGARNPPTVTIEAGSIPQPYRKLLVHTESMTSALKTAYQEEIGLRVLHQECSEQILSRQVVLVRQSDGKPVEFGLIRIHLEHFSPEPKRRVVEGNVPLGKLLPKFGMQYSNRPSAFFQVASEGMIGEALSLSDPCNLYGRCNRLSVPYGQILADVIEILAPCEPGSVKPTAARSTSPEGH